ncbi:MAG: 16S rRNA (guanine(527)-N(7))-methyltransferase RsmG [Eubacteriales bacterium]|nr:16S rRNA (guanine(527)-N(7))-methyltransferase RsmG [Eubacteriales bacterium]
MDETFRKWIPDATDEQLAMLNVYYDMLTDWNTRMNLTAITEREEVAKKHFADSLLPVSLLAHGAKLIDVGTGAGFPGLVLKIMRPDISLTLLDSLNKRVTFLQAVCDALALSDVACVHARAEDGAKDKALRERFDAAAARAVAHTAFLAEWLVPYLKVGGKAFLYKGPQAETELREAENACRLLHADAAMQSYDVPWGERSVVILTKKAPTDKRYPRKAGAKEYL